MSRPGLKNEKLLALFVLGLVLFAPPLLTVFDKGPDTMIFGVPVLFAYLFLAWGLLIFLVARTDKSEHRADDEPDAPQNDPPYKDAP